MFKNYLKITLRLFKKQKVYSMINVLGLAIGLAACMIIFLFVQDELSYDQYHSKKDNIYRLLFKSPTSNNMLAIVPGKAKSLLDGSFPEIKSVTRIFAYSANLRAGENTFYEGDIAFADSNIFAIFDWPLLYGDKATVLQKPNALVLSEKAARKYFGNENPIGKMMQYDNEINLEVTGVMKDIPLHSHFRTDFIASVDLLEKINPGALNVWGNASARYYLLTREDANIAELQIKIKEVFTKIEESRLMASADIYLQNLSDVHLYSKQVDWDIAQHGDINSVYVFSLSALFILIIACFNFMNLSTARSARRAREVGLRKVMGADRRRLVAQFLGESFIYTLLALLIAMVLVELVLPRFNTIVDKSLYFNPLLNHELAIYLLLIVFVVFLAAGSYPAFILSSFKPTVVLKGNMMQNVRKSAGKYQLRFRQVLVLIQFIICTGLIIGSVLLMKQMNYIQQKDLGYERENIMIIQNPMVSGMAERYDALKNSLRSNPHVMAVSGARNVPGANINNYTNFILESDTTDNRYHMGYTVVDYDYFALFGTDILEGRNFSTEYALDTIESAIINESAAKVLGLENPVGEQITGFRDQSTKRIVGVVKDMHFQSLKEEVEPLAFYPSKYAWPNYTLYLAVRFMPNAPPEIIDQVETSWKEIAPEWPLHYEFMDARVDGFYRTEVYTSRLIRWFTILVIIVSFAGLYGLTFYMIESRTREIGIRKILGAKVGGIMMMLSREMLVLIALANIIAWPLIYWFISDWLQKFVYRIEISPLIFIASGLLVMFIAISTVIFHTRKQARLNPVDAVKYE